MGNNEKVSKNKAIPPVKPAMTADGQMDRLVALAASCAEQQMLDGTASSQVITFFLKYGTAQSKLECEKLRHENTLLEAKTSEIQANAQRAESYEKVIAMLTKYQTGEDQ